MKKRALVVFADGESQAAETLAADFAGEPRIFVTFVPMGDPSERSYESGVAEAGYVPPSDAAEILATAASAVDGRVLDEVTCQRLRRPCAPRSRPAPRARGASRATGKH